MKNIEMQELQVGDIFTQEMKLYNREAFKVIDIKEKTIICQSRTSNKIVNKPKTGNIILLRHE